MNDPVNHPDHYKSHPSGIEAIDVTEHFNFNLGNAIKYIWRADSKGKPLEDIRKARWYLDREISRRVELEERGEVVADRQQTVDEVREVLINWQRLF